MIKKLIIVSLISSSLFSLTLEEAVERGVANSSVVKNAQYNIKSKEIELSLANTGFRPRVDLNYIKTYRDEATASFPKEYDVISLTGSINLFNGFSDEYKSKGAKETLLVSKLEKKAAISDLRLLIKQYYINHINGKNEEKNQQASLELAKEQLSTAKLQLEQGIIAKDDYLKVEVNTLNTQKNLLQASSKVKTSWLALKRVLGGQLKKEESILTPKTSPMLISYSNLKTKMLENRSELKALKRTKHSLGYQEKSLKGGYYPKADLVVNHNIYEKEVKRGNSIVQPKDETVAKVILSWNLYGGGMTKNSVNKVKYTKLIINEKIKDLKLNLEYQLESAYTNIEIATKTLSVAKKTKESAFESYKTTKEKYKEGVATNTELLDAREDFTKASSALNSAKFNLLLSYATLERVVGE